MPHKRNPVAAASALGAATMAPNLAATIFAAQVQDHERSAGQWHAEWPTLPTLMLVTSGALAAIVDIAEGLEVDVARMRANLDVTHGLIMAEAVTFALAEKIGKVVWGQSVPEFMIHLGLDFISRKAKGGRIGAPQIAEISTIRPDGTFVPR